MNILFFMNNYPDSRNGGIENVTRMLSERFNQAGHRIHIRYLHESKFVHTDDTIFKSCKRTFEDNIKDEISDTVKQYEIDIIVNRCVIFASPILREAISDTKCKLITTYNNKPTLTPPTIKEVFTNTEISLAKKLIILLSYPIFTIRSRKKLQKCHQNSYAISDCKILLSKQYIPEYIQLMKIDSNKLVYLNNPIKDSLSISATELECKEKTILMVTRLDETQKCIIKAMKVWNRLSSVFPHWKLQIVGSGPDEAKIKKYANDNRIKNLEFHPAQSPEVFYRKASIFLMTSRNEGWPNTLNEAMRLGCVPIAIDTFSAVYDIIDDGKNGFIIHHSSEVNDIRNCIKSISKLIQNKALLNEMAINACKKTEHLSLTIIAKQWIELFEKTLSKQ